MNTLDLFNLFSIAILLLIVHSYFKRGIALTLNFFLFSFMLTFTKGGAHGFKFINSSMSDFLIIFYAALSVLVWILIFYLAWYIAEKIMGRIKYLEGRVFSTLLFAGIVVASLAYAINVTAINIGWWGNPTIKDSGIFLISFDNISDWFYFSVHFLAAYFLIACSEYKARDYKTVFFILPFLYIWVPQFFGKGLPKFIEEFFALTALLILAFFSPLRFDYSGIKVPSPRRFLKKELLELLPMLVIFIFLFILAFLDIAKIHNARLLISLLPISFLIMLAIKRMPLLWIITLAIICLAFFNKQAVPAAIPVVFMVLFELSAKPYIIEGNY